MAEGSAMVILGGVYQVHLRKNTTFPRDPAPVKFLHEERRDALLSTSRVFELSSCLYTAMVAEVAEGLGGSAALSSPGLLKVDSSVAFYIARRHGRAPPGNMVATNDSCCCL